VRLHRGEAREQRRIGSRHPIGGAPSSGERHKRRVTGWAGGRHGAGFALQPTLAGCRARPPTALTEPRAGGPGARPERGGLCLRIPATWPKTPGTVRKGTIGTVGATRGGPGWIGGRQGAYSVIGARWPGANAARGATCGRVGRGRSAVGCACASPPPGRRRRAHPWKDARTASGAHEIRSGFRTGKPAFSVSFSASENAPSAQAQPMTART